MSDLNFDIQRFAEVINLTESNDNYAVTGSDKIIYAKGGNDSIYYTRQNNVTIVCGDGADTVNNGTNGANNFSISGGAGNDSIYNN